jgi:hypothetical protein
MIISFSFFVGWSFLCAGSFGAAYIATSPERLFRPIRSRRQSTYGDEKWLPGRQDARVLGAKELMPA